MLQRFAKLCVMALTDAQKQQILDIALGESSKSVAVDGLSSNVQQRSVSELRQILELVDDLDAGTGSPAGRIGLSTIIPPGSLAGGYNDVW